MAAATASRRIDTALLARAESVGSLFHRSGTEQLEHWASLGAAVETVLGFPSVAKLKSVGQAPKLDHLIGQAGTPAGNAKLTEFLKTQVGKMPGLNAAGRLVSVDSAAKPARRRAAIRQ